MIVLIVILVAAAAVAGLYLFCLCPNRGRQGRMAPFMETFIAHRGLYSNPTIPENSLPAFARAVRHGYGIELDVQLTADDQLVVFHDETLLRACGDARKLHTLTYGELEKLSLFGTGEKIPLLRDVLAAVGGAVPLIVEIKKEGRYLETTRRTHAMLQGYSGVYCVESFHPLVMRWFRKHSPETIRGQLSTDFGREEAGLAPAASFVLTNLLLNFLSRPDFIAYNRLFQDQGSFNLCRRLFHPVNVAWTVKSGDQLEADRARYQVFIFEGFLPSDNTEQ